MLAFCVNINAQEEKLQPELDISSGLQSNAVRCIKVDTKGRVWVGMDNGLNILNANTAAQKMIVEIISHKSIWAIDFLDSLVFIGTRYEGLYIFNQATGNLHKSYAPSVINKIRKIKIFSHQIFILTNEGPYKWERDSLQKLPLTSNFKGDFLTDMFQWDNNLYGLAYPSKEIVRFSNNSFEENSNDFFQGNKNLSLKENYFSALCYDGKLILGSGGLTQSLLIIEKGKNPLPYNLFKSFGSGYVIWDIQVFKDKLVLAVGDTYSNSRGILLIQDIDYLNAPTKATDYITCLALDSVNNTLYYGTLEKGVYLQRGLSGSGMLDKTLEAKIIGNEKNTVVYTDNLLQRYPSANFKASSNSDKISDAISAINLCGDTLVYANDNFLKLLNPTSLKPIKVISRRVFNIDINISAVQLLNHTIFCFNSYGYVFKYNLTTDKAETIKGIESFNPNPQKFGDKIILFNKERGFNVITEKDGFELSSKDEAIPFTNDFTLINDKLYALLPNELKVFKVDYETHQLVLLQSFSIQNLVEGFIPKWILSKNDQLYLLNDNGILRCSTDKIIPTGYYYFGNYYKLNKPVMAGDSLIIASNNVLTKFSFNEINKPIAGIDDNNLSIIYPESVNENLSFKVTANLADYLLQNHGLKTLEIWRNRKIVSTKYSINSQFTFNDGMKYGNYDFTLKIGKNKVTNKMGITLPLNRNPYFFGAILLCLVVIFAGAVKSIFDKRKFRKELLQNRLQTLKQNLNPHFVYNSMNLISSLILEENYDEAVQVVADFSKLQRTYLETNNKEQISLAEELQFLDSYLNLQKKRFHADNDFEYFIKVPSELDTSKIMVPPLILQPIAENAIKYGVVSSMADCRKIQIDVSGKNTITIGIEDNGKDVEPNINSLGMGIKLVQERIALFNLSRSTNIKIVFGKPPIHNISGYRVELEIPV